MTSTRIAAVAVVATVAATAAQQPQVPGTFRSAVTLVPVDVRVLARDGRPIADLQERDFTIVEDGSLRAFVNAPASRGRVQLPLTGAAPICHRMNA